MANRRAIATLASFLPRRSARWKYLLRHSGTLPTVTWAASTSRKRKMELPCLVMCPKRRRFPLDFSSGTQSEISGYLLPAVKALHLAENQDERQCGERTHSGMGHQALCLRTLLCLLLDRLT